MHKHVCEADYPIVLGHLSTIIRSPYKMDSLPYVVLVTNLEDIIPAVKM